jgi:hypothetical protein
VKRVLIVTPNWPPVSYPDLHRVRMALPYFQQFGWEPIILKIDPDEQQGTKDPTLCLTVPPSVRTRQAGCLPLALTSWCGVRSVGLRSHFHLATAGSEIIREIAPHLVFFSTTMFTVTTLGRYWHRRHGIPYVVDFQDPWVAVEPEQGPRKVQRNQKYRASQSLATRLEPFMLRHASHVVSVSPAYPIMLRHRYPWLRPEQFTVLPFGAAERDFELLREISVKQTVFSPGDGRRHWVYVGRGGPDMALALLAFFKAVRRQVDAHPALRAQLRIHFVGTDYAPPESAKKTVKPLAIEAGIAGMVTEQTARVPYFEALQCLLDADALVVPGSDDPGYTASKLFPYVLARRPLLAIFNAQSSVIDTLARTNAGTVVSFTSADSPESLAERLFASGWLTSQPLPQTNWAAFERYTAREMTSRLCRVFDQCTTN